MAAKALTIVAALAFWTPSVPLLAHEIPARVTVMAFIKPEGRSLRLLVRTPLEAMRDVNFPLRWPGYLDLEHAGPQLLEAVQTWIAGPLELTEDGHRLVGPRIVAIQVSLPSDRSFESWEAALGHVTGPPLPPKTELIWQQALLDVLIEYPIESDHAEFAIRPGPTFSRMGLQTTTVLRFLPPDRGERVFQLVGPAQGDLVRLDPSWYQAALRFVRVGFGHIWDGIDHLLFVFCLVIPVRRFRTLVAIVTSFTVAHSVTLVASTLGLAPSGLWFPPLIEVLIAISILYMAFENILGARQNRRWMLAFGFGLVHGFGFSFFMRDSLQFAGAHLAASLLSFNLGVELGQLVVLLVAVPLLAWLFRRIPERAGVILLSALVAHTAWHWMLERLATLRQFRLQWPTLDVALLSGVLRALMLLLIVAGAGWLMWALTRRLLRPPSAIPDVILEGSESRHPRPEP